MSEITEETSSPSRLHVPEDRLESWKEIAGYLQRGVRTVQRWERDEGLPIYRHEHQKRATPYAFKGELDAWRNKHQEKLGTETLAERLQKGALPLDQALRYAIEIADALDKAHRQGVTHRDLNPANIMLTKAGTKLRDAGLTKLTRSGTDSEASTKTAEFLTRQGAILGTLPYMAPEQLDGREADARTDIWAFGCVVYEMVTGKKAFEGTSQESLIGSIMTADPRPISSLQPMSPPMLDQVVRTCLAKDPDKRWQSAGDIGRQLKLSAESGSQVAVTAPTALSARPARRARSRLRRPQKLRPRSDSRRRKRARLHKSDGHRMPPQGSVVLIVAENETQVAKSRPGFETDIHKSDSRRMPPQGSVVLIVAENEAQVMKSEPGFETEIRVFADTDAIKARQLIASDRPWLVVLGRAFVDSERGGALINAIRTDQTLADTQIRVLGQVSDYVDLVSQRAEAGFAPGTAVPGEPLPADYLGPRQAHRFRMDDAVEVRFGETSATLVDLSRTGAHVVGPIVLRPHQRILFSMVDSEQDLKIAASVVWVFFEPARGDSPSHYRAGVKFINADPEIIDAFSVRHRLK